MPEYQKFFRDADRQQAFADALMQRAIQPHAPQQQGRITPKMGIGHGLTQIGEALLARRQGRKASETREQGESAKQQAMVAALQGLGGQDTMMASTDGAAAIPANPYQAAQQAIDSGVNPALVGEWLKSQQGPEPLKPTDDLQEYEFAKSQGYQGSFQDYMIAQKQAGGVNVNLKNEGTIPTGYRAERDANGNIIRYVPIEGGPAAMEIEAAETAAENKRQGEEQKTDIILQEIDRSVELMDSPGLPETGIGGTLLQNVPGTDAHALQNTLKTIKANIGFDRLQQMRESSPTGGALGNVTVQEIERLEAVLGSLAQSQRPEDLKFNLARLNNLYLDTIHGEGNGPERMELTRSGGRQQAAPDSAPEGVDSAVWGAMTPEEKALWQT